MSFAVRDTRSAALVLLGHGTVLNPDSCLSVLRQANALRASGCFAEVQAGFWKQEPRIQDVLSNIASSEIFIVPMFISEGYFSENVIPRELGFFADGKISRELRKECKLLRYTAAVGTHPDMVHVLVERAEEVVRQFPSSVRPTPGETTLFIAGHGTGRDERSRVSVEVQADAIRRQRRYAAVHPVFMEEPPYIKDWRKLAATRYAVVVPFFISDGLHVTEDIPVLLGEPEALVKERLGHRRPTWENPTEKDGVFVWYASSVGTSPRVADVILARVRQAQAENAA